ncbi:conserved hypothetical protein [Pseudomonas sp. 8BK]|nr:conserved hypothetical protein [Pseudomonas sp. 8BK]
MFFVFFVFFVFALCVSFFGKKDSLWLVRDMWPVHYFNTVGGGLVHEEIVNLMTLQPGVSDDSAVAGYVSGSRCEDATYACMLNTLSAANILFGVGELESGLKLIETARKKIVKGADCPISIESSVLLYKIKMFSVGAFFDVVPEAVATVNKIRTDGGVLYDLRTQSCAKLAKERPELFHEYVVVVSRVMAYAVGEYSSAGAYIQERNKLSY